MDVLYVAKTYTTSSCTVEQAAGTMTVYSGLFVAPGFGTEGYYDFKGGNLVVLGPTWIGGVTGPDCSGAEGTFTNSSGGLHTQTGTMYIGAGHTVWPQGGSGT